MKTLAASFSLLILMAGCSQPSGQAPEGPGRQPKGLTIDLQVGDGETARAGEPVALLLVLTASGPVTLQFNSGQRFDFIIRADGEEVWRWSEDQFFTQALGEESLSAGDELRYDAQWTPEEEGSYGVLGTVTASNPDLIEEGSLSAEATLTVENRG